MPSKKTDSPSHRSSQLSIAFLLGMKSYDLCLPACWKIDELHLVQATTATAHECRGPILSCLCLALPNLWLSQSFWPLFHGDSWAFRIGSDRCPICGWVFTDIYSLKFDQWWVSELTAIHRRKKPLWWDLGTVLICTWKGIKLNGGLILCLFRK